MRRLLSAMLVCVVIGAFAVPAWLYYRNDEYFHQMQPLYEVIAAGEQGWGTEGIQMIHQIIHDSSDRHRLAEQLMNEQDGSLVAEGMILAVQSQHPGARRLVEAHLADKRWNWSLANNDDVAAQLVSYLRGLPTEKWILQWIDETAKACGN